MQNRLPLLINFFRLKPPILPQISEIWIDLDYIRKRIFRTLRGSDSNFSHRLVP